MGTDKNIKLHIVTDIKIKMLSRLSAVRSLSGLRQVIRPCLVASTTSSRDFSLSSPVDNKYAWYKTAWPSFKMYKEMAGESAGTVFAVGTISYLLSKEVYVINDESMTLALMLIVGYYLTKTVGPMVSKALDDERLSRLNYLNQMKVDQLANLEEAVAEATEGDAALALRHEFTDIAINREEMNVELEYRRRLHLVESEVKKRLDYQLDLQSLEQSIEERHMAAWVESEVVKSITEEQEEEALLQCIRDLNGLADARGAA